MDNMFIPERNLVTFNSANQVSTQAIALQPMQNQLVEIRLFYQDGDDNIYHVTCKRILQDYLQGSENSIPWDDNYDYEFFFNDSTTLFHVTCKLLPNSLIVNLLNNKFYGMGFDERNLNHRCLLTLHQKLNLEQNLKRILPWYFSQQQPIPNENMNNSMVNN